MKKLALTIGAVLGAVLIAPKFVGGVVENKYNDILDQLGQNPSIEITSKQFSRDWFSGTSIVRLKLAGQYAALNDIEFVVKEDLSFGPVIFEQGLSFNLARSQATISFDGALVDKLEDKDLAEISQALQENLLITSHINYSMDMISHLTLNEIVKEQDGNKFKFGKLTGDFTLTDEKFATTDILWQGLEFSGPKASVNVAPVTIELEQELITGNYYAGDAFVVGGGSIKVPAISVKQPSGEQVFSLTDLVLTGDSSLNNNLVDMTINYNVKEVNVAEQVYKNGNLSVDVTKLDAEVLKELNSTLTQLSSQKDPQAGAMVGMQMMMIATKLLENNPEITISDLSVETTDGKIQSDMFVAIDNKVYNPNNPMTLVGALKANAKGKGPAQFFEKMGLKEMLDMYVEQGLLVKENNDLSFSVQFEQGQLNVNGKPMPL